MKLYRQVDPIDTASAEGEHAWGSLLVISPMQPMNHSLDIQWWVDGVLTTNNATTFDTSTLSETETHSVAVRVIDNTDGVRFECARAELMRSERIWTITP